MSEKYWFWTKAGTVAVLVLANVVLWVLILHAASVQSGTDTAPWNPRSWDAQRAMSSPSRSRAAPTPSPPRGMQERNPAPLSTKVDQALAATTWPALHPSPQTLQQQVHAPAARFCEHVSPGNVSECSFGPEDADKVAVVLGDDVGASWLPGIRAALEPHGWRVEALTYAGCPASTIWVIRSGSTPDVDGDALTRACADHQQWADSRVQRMRPDLVIFASGENTLNRLATGAHGVDAQRSWRIAVTDSINRLRGVAGRTVVLAPPPEGTDIRQCDRDRPPIECSFSVDKTWKRMSSTDQAAAAATGATYVGTSEWFCNAGGRCPAFVGDTIVRSDGVHLTATYSRRLASLLAGALLASGPDS